jgi:hypothetical protein
MKPKSGKTKYEPPATPTAAWRGQPQRIEALKGRFEVPDDIDTMFQEEIEEMFYGESPPPFGKPEE